MGEDEFVPLDAVRTPLEIDNQIQWSLYYQRKATHAINELRIAYVKAKDAYTKAFKEYKFAHRGEGGTVSDRDDAAQLANWDLYSDMVAAELVLSHAKDKRDDIKATLSAAQTEVKLIVAEMALSGHGGA